MANATGFCSGSKIVPFIFPVVISFCPNKGKVKISRQNASDSLLIIIKCDLFVGWQTSAL